jgi:hypothetical protein
MGFADQIGNFRQKAVSRHAEVVDKVAFDLFEHIIEDTPVDTGKAKGGWSHREIQDGHELANNVEYIKALEYGSSKQAPEGMVRVNMAQSEKILQMGIKKAK